MYHGHIVRNKCAFSPLDYINVFTPMEQGLHPPPLELSLERGCSSKDSRLGEASHFNSSQAQRVRRGSLLHIMTFLIPIPVCLFITNIGQGGNGTLFAAIEVRRRSRVCVLWLLPIEVMSESY